MKKLMNILMLSCSKATELMEKKSSFGLNRREKIQLVMHTSMCSYCAKYQKQSNQLDDLLKVHIGNFNNGETNSNVDLKELKNKINTEIEKES